MILQCPECGTRYLLPDSAVGADGRTVRCAQCRHSWFQEPQPLELTPEAEVEEVAPTVAPEPPEPVTPAPAAPLPPPIRPLFADAPSLHDEPRPDPEPVRSPVVPPRHNPARRWTAAAAAAGLLMMAGTGAITWLGAPGLAGRLGLPVGSETPLRIRDNPIERRELDNGSELFAVSGQVLNPSSSRQRVPDIRAELRDAGGRIVYSWTIKPQTRTLAPGAALEFNSATLDVPPTSKRLELSFEGEG